MKNNIGRFKTISTKNLYLVTINTISSIDSNYTHYNTENRYVMAYKIDDLIYFRYCARSCPRYQDIFTGTIYSSYVSGREGECVARSAQGIITNKQEITKKEALHILREMNPTYLPEYTTNDKVKKFK